MTRPVVLIALLGVVPTVPCAAEDSWPERSASELSIFVTTLRFRNQADHCAVAVPALQPKFKTVMDNLTGRIRNLSVAVVDSAKFKDMKNQPVPAVVVNALEDSFHDGERSFARFDAAVVCPETLQAFGQVDDDSLKFSLVANLKAVRNMVENIERARQSTR